MGSAFGKPATGHRLSYGLDQPVELMDTLEIGRLLKLIHSIVSDATLGTNDEAPLYPRIRITLTNAFEELLPICQDLNLLVPTEYVNSSAPNFTTTT